jgi:3-deoxy-D-arabino-heptulosonate 7-phosphate (DAHP) synthase class II
VEAADHAPSPGELSSLARQLADLADRVAVLVQAGDAESDAAVGSLVEVERHLQGARRELDRLARRRR